MKGKVIECHGYFQDVWYLQRANANALKNQFKRNWINPCLFFLLMERWFCVVGWNLVWKLPLTTASRSFNHLVKNLLKTTAGKSSRFLCFSARHCPCPTIFLRDSLRSFFLLTFWYPHCPHSIQFLCITEAGAPKFFDLKILLKAWHHCRTILFIIISF